MKKLCHISVIALLLLLQKAKATSYYVCGTYTAGTSVYCTASGTNSATNGKNPATPMATLTYLWATYGPAGTNVLTAGDIIYIDAGIYFKTDINLNITVAGLTFQGAGLGVTVFDDNLAGASTNYFMYINTNNVSVRDITVQKYQNNGTQTPGTSGQAFTLGNGSTAVSGILLYNVQAINNGSSGGNPSIMVLAKTTATIQAGGSFCNTTGTVYTGGIGAYGYSIDLTIKDYVLSNNYKTGYEGGGLMVEGNNTTVVKLFNSTVSYNQATDGGGIASCGYLEIEDCIIESNYIGDSGGGPDYGGGIYITGGTAYIRRSIIRNNVVNSSYSGSSIYGAGLAAYSIGDWGSTFSPVRPINITIDSCTFSGNSTGSTTHGNDIYAKVYSSSSNSVTINCNNVTFSSATSQIITNSASGTPAINLTNCGSPKVDGTTVSSGAVSYSANPNPPTFSGTCPTTIVIMPVELISFESFCSANKINLQWQTASEQNNRLFSIEKSNDGLHFTSIGRVAGAGNSSTLRTYNFTDNENSTKMYYRLAQQDYNGVVHYSKIINAVGGCGNSSGNGVFVYPNPFASTFHVHALLSVSQNVSVELYNGLGEQVSISNGFYEEGILDLEIRAEHLASGVYVAKIGLQDTVFLQKVIKSEPK